MNSEEIRSSTAETAPAPQKLIGNSIPSLVTEVPAIEVPTKFEDLLEDPRIVFKSVSGNHKKLRRGTFLNYVYKKGGDDTPGNVKECQR